ncbi:MULTISPECIES: acyltransferase [Nostoc]|uniref:Acyltransferase n=1 Tax=Nostoc paludosum FACHB-159 TaxID=2692908 RepID=A0ABR8K428_9NOSO|nr:MULTISPECIES: acyltransferase [Nostoc]MBD2677425.1 acyltransferase [Nostoc sp. FACHB-857]MBD2734181.1 acyltransferase [Nostoc paludosum FACHB-159]
MIHSELFKSSPNPEKISHLVRGYMPVLNGYRGIAILLVFLYHCVSDIVGEPVNPLVSIYQKIMQFGWCGVDAFFVISGFLITGILLDNRDRPNYFKNFYVRRIIRIFPVYYIVLILFLGVIRPLTSSYEPQNDLDRFQIWYWFYLENLQWVWQGRFDIGPISHFWSLAVEEQFYLVYPLLVYLIPRKFLSWFLGIVIIGVVLYRHWLLLTNPVTFQLTAGIYVNTLCRLDTLAIGSLIALWMRSETMIPWLVKIAPIAMIVSSIGLMIIFVIQGGVTAYTIGMDSIGFTLLAIFFGSLIVLSITKPQNSFLPRVLNWPPLQALGIISYGFYVYHVPLGFPLIDRVYQYTEKYIGNYFIVSHLIAVFFFGILTLLISIFSWYFLEQPFLKLKTYFASQKGDNLNYTIHSKELSSNTSFEKLVNK